MLHCSLNQVSLHSCKEIRVRRYLKDLKQSCSLKAAEWAERQKSAGEELAVIEKAKEILSSGVKVFLQVQPLRFLHSMIVT